MIDTRHSIAYANKRANETKRRYFVTVEGHALYDCQFNRKAFEDVEIVYVTRPRKH